MDDSEVSLDCTLLWVIPNEKKKNSPFQEDILNWRNTGMTQEM